MNYSTDNPKVTVFDRYTERNLSGGNIVFDRSDTRNCHCRFNVMAIRMLKLDDKKNIQFTKIGDEWFISVTDLNRGYKLNRDGNVYRINAKIFINEFLENLNYSCRTVRFRIKATNHELAGQPLFRIYQSRILKP